MGQYQSNYGHTTSYQPSSQPTYPSTTHTYTNRVLSPTIQKRSNYFESYSNDSSNVGSRQDHTNSTYTRTTETNNTYPSYGHGPSYIDRSRERVPSRSSSRHETRHKTNNNQSSKADRDIFIL